MERKATTAQRSGEMYFAQSQDIQGRRFLLQGDEARHCFRVMRNQIGDEILLTDGEGREYRAQITKINQRSGVVEGEILEIKEGTRELKREIYLAFAPIKSRDLNFMIEKATELGVRGFIPIKTERQVANFQERRAQKVAIRGIKTALGSFLPKFFPPIPFSGLLSSVRDYSLALLAYEREEARYLKDIFANANYGKRILLIIGPEGGFSPSEVEEARTSGILTFSLGKRRLASGTAALCALSLIIGYTQ